MDNIIEKKLLRVIDTPSHVVKQLIMTPLTIGEIRRAVPDIPVELYNKIPDGAIISEWLKRSPSKCAILLYLWDKNKDGAYGHYISVLNRGNVLEIFDSFANEPDGLREFLKPDKAKYLNQGKLKLLRGMGHNEGRYNDKKLQNKNAECCGRWAILRCLFRDYDEETFANTIKKMAKKYGMTNDYLCVLLSL